MYNSVHIVHVQDKYKIVWFRTYCTCTIRRVPPCFTYSRVQDAKKKKKKKYKRQFLSSNWGSVYHEANYQSALAVTIWSIYPWRKADKLFEKGCLCVLEWGKATEVQIQTGASRAGLPHPPSLIPAKQGTCSVAPPNWLHLPDKCWRFWRAAFFILGTLSPPLKSGLSCNYFN